MLLSSIYVRLQWATHLAKFFFPWRLMYLVGAGMYMNQTTSLRGLSSQPAKNFAAYHLGKIKIKGYMPWNFFNMIYIYIYIPVGCIIVYIYIL